MDKNIIFDTGKSSRINKRASQDATLIKEAGIVEFVIIEMKIILSQTAVNQQNHFQSASSVSIPKII